MNSFISINPDRCIACGTCQAACSAGHASVGKQAEPRLSVIFTSDVTASITCHHCEGAPCLAVCPVNAITQEDDRVVVNEQTCIGCKMCNSLQWHFNCRCCWHLQQNASNACRYSFNIKMGDWRANLCC